MRKVLFFLCAAASVYLSVVGFILLAFGSSFHSMETASEKFARVWLSVICLVAAIVYAALTYGHWKKLQSPWAY